MASFIMNKTSEGKNILVVLGANHVFAQGPAYKKFWQKIRG